VLEYSAGELKSQINLEWKKIDPLIEVKLNFSLGTSESEADERLLLVESFLDQYADSEYEVNVSDLSVW
jgi:hypothetical protein